MCIYMTQFFEREGFRVLTCVKYLYALKWNTQYAENASRCEVGHAQLGCQPLVKLGLYMYCSRVLCH